MIDTVIVGGGAAGLVCAVRCAQAGLKVVVLERMDRVGKKLLATGNGRCNLMNTGEPEFYRGASFASELLTAFSAQAQRSFWESLGLRLRQEEAGRVYPASLQASTVLDILRMTLDDLGVMIRTEEKVTALRRGPRGWETLCESGFSVRSRFVLIAGGGCAQPKLGSDGSAAALLGQLGHTVHPFSPVLTALTCDMKHLAGLSGIRVKARVTAEQDGQALRQEDGEVLFTDYGLSGVAVMNCSGVLQDRGAAVVLDLLPALGLNSEVEAVQWLLRRRNELGTQPMELLMTGLTVPRLAMNMMRAAGITAKGRAIGSFTEKEAAALAHTLHAFRIPVTGRRGFEQAQVSRGGAAPEEFDPKTCRSRRFPGLYAAGEVLDVDGACGGWHLMFAFACAMAAAKAMTEER